ncbi:unnamed protein product [Zymoseptoria tritici ST99CH_3D1]|nr:unnamed protein product [Zymoseptoria tritici ST99CH_3D1]
MATSSPKATLKILMLHGYTQSGHLFAIKTKALKKSLEKAFPAAPKPGHLTQYPGGVELVYPTGPLKLNPAELPGADLDGAADDTVSEAYGWWRRKDVGPGSEPLYADLDSGLRVIAETLKNDGPFAGVIGFSQGGAAAALVASLLDEGRVEAFQRLEKSGSGMPYPPEFLDPSTGKQIHPPLKFAASYSGFRPGHPQYEAFFTPKIQTRMCHFVGSVDTVVSEERVLALAKGSEEGKGRVVYHPGGHFLPASQKQTVAALIGFVREVVEGGGGDAKEEEERAEDMELPF